MRSMLIVARSALWRDLLSARLEHEGFAVTVANDSSQALAQLAAPALPGAVLVDTTLPKKEWQRIRTRLDNDARLQPVRRLFVVGALPTSQTHSGPVFEKPVDPEHVTRALRALYPDTDRFRKPAGRYRAPEHLDEMIQEALAANS
jgi:CheY-like chemotaxis protein